MNTTRPRFLRCFAALGAALCVVALSAAPTNVLLRVPAGAAVPAELPPLLAKWRQSGQAANVLFLTQGRPETAKDKQMFEALAVLEFPSEEAWAVWQRDCAPALPAGVLARRADALTHGEITPRDSNRSVFVVNVYTPTVERARYDEFVQAYITPLYAAQRAGKHLVRSTLYHEHGDTGRANSIAILEYRDPHAFAAGAAQKDGIRTRLTASNPGYVKFHPIKDQLRTNDGGNFATYTELPPPDLGALPAYQPEVKIVGGVRIVGSELKNAVPRLAEGFMRFHPEARVTTSHIPSSEGGIAGLYSGISDVAPMGDDAKITDLMPFHNAFGYMPVEISVATGGYEKRGSLFAWAIVVSRDNPLDEISVEELERVFGAERTGGWELANNNYLYTSKFARARDRDIRTWDQLGLKGEFVGKEIETFGYCAPGFATYFERNWFHWSKKWNPNFREFVETKQTTPDAHGPAVDSQVPLRELAKNKFLIGIAALMHAKNHPHVKVLRISPRKGAPAVALTPDSVAGRAYPLIRDAFFYVNRPPGRPLDPRAREFMRFVLSREGQEIIASVGYYYPLPPDYLREQLKKLD